jgi:hypothetical protein
VLEDLNLDEAPQAARPRTAGERALDRLEVQRDANTALDDDRLAAGVDRLWEPDARAAAAAAGPR